MHNSPAIHLPEPDVEELVRRAQAMIPLLREQADAVEKARCVPASTIAAFQEAGFFKILQPRRWGGYQMPQSAFYRVLMELGRGCCSSAWNLMILGIHQWEIGQFDVRAGNEIWGQSANVLIASSYPPVGQYKRAEGGWLVSGTWPTSSGSDHAQWAILGLLKRNDQGQPQDHVSALVPRTHYTLVDDWYTFGLAGTGSKSVVLREVFVPDYRIHSISGHPAPGLPALYAQPHRQVFFGAVSSAIVGMAQGAIDLFTEQMKTRLGTFSGNAAVLSPYVRDRLANAVARVRSSRMRLLSIAATGIALAEQGEQMPLADRVAHALDMARVGRECEEAVLLLYKATGARGIFTNNPMQRVLRDVLAAANHITQNADDLAGQLGNYLLTEAVPPLAYGPVTT